MKFFFERHALRYIVRTISCPEDRFTPHFEIKFLERVKQSLPLKFDMSNMSEATQALNYALKRIEDEFKELPDGQDMIDKITNKFVQTSNSPPRSDFEFVLHKTFTDDEVCIALFKPREEQVSYFPTILAAANSMPMGHPLTRNSPLLISLLFLVHR